MSTEHYDVVIIGPRLARMMDMRAWRAWRAGCGRACANVLICLLCGSILRG